MRILPRLSGSAVLLLALFGIHVIHHLYVGAPHDSALFWLGMIVAACIDVLSFVGGYMLVTQSR
jgi:hypothetical protein